jgi:hypothetical protein
MLMCGLRMAVAQDVPQQRAIQPDPAERRLFQPSLDGDPSHPQRFGRPNYGYSANGYYLSRSAGATGFDSTNTRAKRQLQRNVERRRAVEQASAQPVVAPVPDMTVAPMFRPVPTSVAQSRAQSRSAGSPENNGGIPRPVRKVRPEEDPFGPLGIRAGTLILRPAIEVYVGHDSNPPLSPNPSGSMFQALAPELQIQSDWSRHEFTADLKGKYTWYNELDNFNKPDVDLNAKARIDLTTQTRANLEGRYKLLADSPNDPNLPQGIAKPPIYYQTGATAGLAHRFNRLEVSGKGLFDRTAYDEAELNDGSIISLKDRNYDQYSGLLRAGYEVYPGVTPFVEGGIDRRVHDLQHDFSGIQRDSDGKVIRAGSTFELTGYLVGEASIGWLQRDYKDPTLGQIHGLIYDASLIYYATPLTTLKLTANSRVDESVLPGVSGALTREVGLQIDHSFRRWLIGTLKLGYGQDDYEGSTRVDDRYSVSSALTYKLTREIHIKGEFRREWLRSNVEGVDYTANIAMVGLRFQR